MTTLREQTTCCVNDLGLIGYERAYAVQKQAVNALLQGGIQTVFLCEHPPTLTLGRLAEKNHMLMSRKDINRRGVDVHSIDRGGDITLHAPGQLVIYPVLNLINFGKDLHLYLQMLEQVGIDLLDDFDIVASRFPGQTGVWAGSRKIASIGIGVRKWITYHGMAININTDLELFSMIKPCGLNVTMTSLSQEKGRSIDMKEVKEKLIKRFSNVFQLKRRGL